MWIRITPLEQKMLKSQSRVEFSSAVVTSLINMGGPSTLSKDTVNIVNGYPLGMERMRATKEGKQPKCSVVVVPALQCLCSLHSAACAHSQSSFLACVLDAADLDGILRTAWLLLKNPCDLVLDKVVSKAAASSSLHLPFPPLPYCWYWHGAACSSCEFEGGGSCDVLAIRQSQWCWVEYLNLAVSFFRPTRWTPTHIMIYCRSAKFLAPFITCGNSSRSIFSLFQKLQNTEEVKCSLERQHNQLTADLSKSEAASDFLLNGFHNDSLRHDDITPHQVCMFVGK